MPSSHNNLPLAATFSVSLNCCDGNNNRLKVEADEIMVEESKNDPVALSHQPFISGELWLGGDSTRKETVPWHMNPATTSTSPSLRIEKGEVWGNTASLLLQNNTKNQQGSIVATAIKESSPIPLYTFYGDQIWTQQHPSNFATETTVTCSVVSPERPTNTQTPTNTNNITDDTVPTNCRSPLVEVVIGWGEGTPETRIAGIIYSSHRENEDDNDDDNFSMMSDVTW